MATAVPSTPKTIALLILLCTRGYNGDIKIGIEKQNSNGKLAPKKSSTDK